MCKCFSQVFETSLHNPKSSNDCRKATSKAEQKLEDQTRLGGEEAIALTRLGEAAAFFAEGEPRAFPHPDRTQPFSPLLHFIVSEIIDHLQYSAVPHVSNTCARLLNLVQSQSTPTLTYSGPSPPVQLAQSTLDGLASEQRYSLCSHHPLLPALLGLAIRRVGRLYNDSGNCDSGRRSPTNSNLFLHSIKARCFECIWSRRVPALHNYFGLPTCVRTPSPWALLVGRVAVDETDAVSWLRYTRRGDETNTENFLPVVGPCQASTFSYRSTWSLEPSIIDCLTLRTQSCTMAVPRPGSDFDGMLLPRPVCATAACPGFHEV